MNAIIRFNHGVGSTLGHGTLGPGDPYIIRLKAEVERALGAGEC